MSGQNSGKKLLVCQVESSLFLKACVDGMSTTSDGSEVQLSTALKETLFRPFCYCVTIHHQQIAVDTVHAKRILVGGNHVSTLRAIFHTCHIHDALSRKYILSQSAEERFRACCAESEKALKPNCLFVCHLSSLGMSKCGCGEERSSLAVTWLGTADLLEITRVCIVEANVCHR